MKLGQVVEQRLNGDIPSPIVLEEFPVLSKYVDLVPGRAVCVVGPTNVGKTHLSLSFAVNLMMQERKVLYLSTEKPAGEFTEMLLNNLGICSAEEMRDEEWLSMNQLMLNEYMEKVDEQLEFIPLSAGMSNGQIMKLLKKFPDHDIVYDHIEAQDMIQGRKDSIDFLVKNFVEHTVDNNVISFGFCQSKPNAVGDNVHSTANSNEIVMKFPTVLFLQEVEEDERWRRLIVMKCKTGFNKRYVELVANWDENTMREGVHG